MSSQRYHLPRAALSGLHSMTSPTRWASEAYPGQYRADVNRAIGFSGLGMDLFTRAKAEDLLKLVGAVSNMTPTDAVCLDIGCGIGVSHALIALRTGQLYGLDVSADAIEIARANNVGVEYRVQDGNQLPIADASIDCSSTVCVMHHVAPEQWPGFVAEAWRVTKPGGLFAVYEHNPLNPLTKWAVWRCPFDHDAVLLTSRRVKALLKSQGFEIVTHRYLFFVPLDRPWARKIDWLLRWLPFGAQYVVCGRKPMDTSSARVKNPT